MMQDKLTILCNTFVSWSLPLISIIVAWIYPYFWQHEAWADCILASSIVISTHRTKKHYIYSVFGACLAGAVAFNLQHLFDLFKLLIIQVLNGACSVGAPPHFYGKFKWLQYVIYRLLRIILSPIGVFIGIEVLDPWLGYKSEYLLMDESVSLVLLISIMIAWILIFDYLVNIIAHMHNNTLQEKVDR